MNLIDIDLKEHGYVLLMQGMQSASLKERQAAFLEWYKGGQSTGVVIRVYREDNKVILYKERNFDHLRSPEILFNGKINSLELLEFIYSLVL